MKSQLSLGLGTRAEDQGSLSICRIRHTYINIYMHILILMFFTNNPVCSWMESTLEQASVLSHPVCSSLLSLRTMTAGGSLALVCYQFPGSFASSSPTTSATLQSLGWNRHRQHLV